MRTTEGRGGGRPCEVNGGLEQTFSYLASFLLKVSSAFLVFSALLVPSYSFLGLGLLTHLMLGGAGAHNAHSTTLPSLPTRPALHAVPFPPQPSWLQVVHVCMLAASSIRPMTKLRRRWQ